MILYNEEILKMICSELHSRGRVIVFAPGCFDLLHVGHVEMLRWARRQGDFLVAATNTDDSIARAKGPNRPIVPLEDRMVMLDALRCVDAVISYDADTPNRLCMLLRPDVMVKGGEYAEEIIPGASYCGRTLFAPMVAGVSTTRITAKAGSKKSS